MVLIELGKKAYKIKKYIFANLKISLKNYITLFYHDTSHKMEYDAPLRINIFVDSDCFIDLVTKM